MWDLNEAREVLALKDGPGHDSVRTLAVRSGLSIEQVGSMIDYARLVVARPQTGGQWRINRRFNRSSKARLLEALRAWNTGRRSVVSQAEEIAQAHAMAGADQ